MQENANQTPETPPVEPQTGQAEIPNVGQPVDATSQAPVPQPDVTQPLPEQQPSLYRADPGSGSLVTPQEPIRWTASEYIAHDKDFSWYSGLAAVSVLLAALLYLVTRDFTSPLVVFFGAFLLGFYGARKPRQLEYELNDKDLVIGEKHIPYSDLKTFALVPEGAFASIRFVPHKRFGPPITIYYGPEDENKIVNALSVHLPMEQHKIDAIDRLMRRIRF